MSGACRTVRVQTPGAESRAYEVRIDPGGLDRLGSLCRTHAPAHRYAVIGDSRVAELYGERALDSFREAGGEADLFPFPAGEWNKTRAEWGRLSDTLTAAGHGRDSVVVALGGGVTGDLAGFVAATFLRGVPVVQAPTTVLAMLDSSVGGKTGVDTRFGKNLLGAFHPPRLVLIDPELLETLPRTQRVAGLAEAVKMAAILDPEMFAWIEEHADALAEGGLSELEEVIYRSVRHKAEVVAADPREEGCRAILNFGHTVGHALELLGGYAVLHGEAVAAGLRAEARLGEAREVTEPGTARRLSRLLERCGLTDRGLEGERPPERVWEAATRDKKARGGEVRCVLLRRIGEVARDAKGRWTHRIPRERGTDWFRAALRTSPES